MGKTQVVVQLPDEIVAEYRQIAAKHNLTLEEVLIATLIINQPETVKFDNLIMPYSDFTDAQLW
jgi:hypothetical protein